MLAQSMRAARARGDELDTEGRAESFPVISDLVSGTLEEGRLYLLDDEANAIALLPLAMCAYDEKTDRHDVFLPRVLATKTGGKIELRGILTGSKLKQTIGRS